MKKINSKTYNVEYKRKREGKTNYKTRLRLLSSHKLRLVVRMSLKNISLQAVEYNPEGDKVLVSASSKQLQKEYGWDKSRGNRAVAYLTGCLLGKKAKDKKLNEMVLDKGGYPNIKKSKVYAALKGVVDAGISVPHSEEIFPSEELIIGEHKDLFESVKKKILG
ncbi:MAG: 50S ribosomal protein L18 [Candidatus Woesearchaeota archaeon]|jgi:large subunit ribosomal protein L18|nr:50S ribosomal protein L18 [Candidatus Woesearchaeota archaeon]MDP7505983.1 50S ribosomal protein L18 [Candidatus Woesearchaeota archaeon]MDP7610446.1 50S ribosomal protein L18 [Candidatus Woesearchaeota archaeon]|tara:strand:- start:34 stop:525 length:492 start_codon:yes stop_codon:yes gene_type:complete